MIVEDPEVVMTTITYGAVVSLLRRLGRDYIVRFCELFQFQMQNRVYIQHEVLFY